MSPDAERRRHERRHGQHGEHQSRTGAGPEHTGTGKQRDSEDQPPTETGDHEPTDPDADEARREPASRAQWEANGHRRDDDAEHPGVVPQSAEPVAPAQVAPADRPLDGQGQGQRKAPRHVDRSSTQIVGERGEIEPHAEDSDDEPEVTERQRRIERIGPDHPRLERGVTWRAIRRREPEGFARSYTAPRLQHDGRFEGVLGGTLQVTVGEVPAKGRASRRAHDGSSARRATGEVPGSTRRCSGSESSNASSMMNSSSRALSGAVTAGRIPVSSPIRSA